METELAVQASKLVNGSEAEEDEVFSFVLEDEAGETLQTVQNAGAKISFAPLLFDQDDIGKTFVYTVREATTSTGTMTCDPAVYTVEVAVTVNGEGSLTASAAVTCAGKEAEAITFNNIIEAPLTISKKVVGCETSERFTFRVNFYHADGTEVTEPVAYTGDVTGTLLSGGLVHLGQGQSITFAGLLPGMRYTVEEYANAAFETTVNTLPMNKVDGICEAEGNRADFVNKLKTTTFTVRKSWQGEDGGVIRLTLYANGEKLEPQPAYTRDGDTYTYTNLPMYNADGELIVYAAKEKYMDGYLTIYDNVPPYDGESKMIYDGGTIINRSVTGIRVQKLWSGLPEGVEPPEIILTLYCNGEPTDRRQPSPDEDGWYVYKNLPRYVNGEEAVYYVVEEAINGFIPVYTAPNGQQAEWAGDGYTITNCLIPATGDNNPVMLWTATFIASAALLLMLKRRRNAN